MIRVLWIIWLAVNLLTFALYGEDKRRAVRGGWRIPERTLLAAAWLLGGVGAALGMKVFRHKTKHAKFVCSVPPAALASLALMALATVRLAGI